MSELHALTVPKWGMSMEEGELMEWHVCVGDTVAVGDPLVDIETSKIVNTAESTVAGTLVRITGQVGDTLDVGALLGVVANGETEQGEIDAFVAAFAPGATAAARSAGGGVETSPPDTAAPAPTVALCPIFKLGATVAPAQTKVPSPTVTVPQRVTPGAT